MGSVQAFAPTRSVHAFTPGAASRVIGQQGAAVVRENVPQSFKRQRRSVSSVATMGLFGLGAPEIAIVLVAIGFVLGPEKLVSIAGGLTKDAGKIASELKDVPAEFQKGFEEGEANVASKKRIGGQQNMGSQEPVRDVESFRDEV